MTRARWLTGAVIGLGALVVAGEALAAYVAGRLVVGVVAVLVLVGVLLIGLASLARARRYVARELAALGAEPAGGALFSARRAQLVALQRRGVAPDLDVLADATAAEEAERGYTGRYLVATTVLIGLVGTFGGLMETLARVAPLLKGDLGAGGADAALALVAAPLAGLHVTFGASVVAILVTLCLALVQGDVSLHHERMLALLQERTRHVLVPELWADGESAAERTVRALQELRAFVGDALTKSAAASAQTVATVVGVEVRRFVEQLGAETRGASAAQTAALERAGASTADALRQTTEAVARELRDAAKTSRDALLAATTKSQETLADATAQAQAALTAVASTSHETLTAAAATSHETLTAAATASRAALEQVTTASQAALEQTVATTRDLTASAAAGLAAATTGSSEAFARATASAVAALGELRASLSAELESSSRGLAAAATSLHGSVETLSPVLAELAPQLGALTAEVALLAARAETPEQPNAVLDELVRLAEDVERLVASGAASGAPPEIAREIES